MENKGFKIRLAGSVIGVALIGTSFAYNLYAESHPDSLTARMGRSIERKFETDTFKFKAGKLIAYGGICLTGLSLLGAGAVDRYERYRKGNSSR